MVIILAPGTGVTGTQTYVGNFNKVLMMGGMYDPVNLDIPDSLLDDIQQNAEYHAYAIKSLSAQTGKQVGIVTWSQGGLDMQWAMKYWPSARPLVSDFVAISPDLNGTTLYGAGPYLETVQGALPLAPSLFQQEQDSAFMVTLRNHGGDSAYVPTTSIYSNADEIVQPQDGPTASAFFKSNNGVPAANYQVQTVCPNAPAGGPFTHEGVLYNSFAIAIAMDAFANPGPGDAKRLDLPKVCALPLAAGLDANDKSLTDGTIMEAAENIIYNTAVFNVQQAEPEIKAYAMKDKPPGYSAPSMGKTFGFGKRMEAKRAEANLPQASIERRQAIAAAMKRGADRAEADKKKMMKN